MSGSLRSETASTSTFLLCALLRHVRLETHLDTVTLGPNINTMHLVFINIGSERLMARYSAATILSLRLVITSTLVSCSRFDTNILDLEFISCKLIQEVLLSYEAAITIFFSVLVLNLVELLDNSLHNLLESEAHSFVVLVVLTNLLVELLVDFLDDTVKPVAHVRIC